MDDNGKFQKIYLEFRKKNLNPPDSVIELQKLAMEARKENAEGWRLYFEAWIAFEARKFEIALEILDRVLKFKPDFYFAESTNVIFGVKAKLYTLRTALAEFGGKGER